MADSLDRILDQWRAERPDLDASPMGVVGRIQRASRLLERGLSEHFATRGLQTWEFDLLATLLRSGPPYRLTAGDLAATSMITSGAITNRIDRLEARSLVSRETDPTNRRSVLVTLTDRGREVVDQAMADHVANEARLIGALRPDEQEQLAGLLRTMLTALGDTPTDARPGRPAQSAPEGG
ncbi:MarR family winged helix-turn-helix transcriptional regulator [Micromonospora sp. MH99]|uniref:MarR family winged helix-turn-helix transcriptional regulator n=1 Tax=Micromonospora sp. MH99 TaxID=1945510 RepID=UPI001F26A118|nr:MarR family transcriptional regulator [Micromonospora sp. MH99]MCF0091890.1 HTH-type transcriptional regulator MhqR [Micromonospora sp. MH99]